MHTLLGRCSSLRRWWSRDWARSDSDAASDTPLLVKPRPQPKRRASLSAVNFLGGLADGASLERRSLRRRKSAWIFIVDFLPCYISS